MALSFLFFIKTSAEFVRPFFQGLFRTLDAVFWVVVLVSTLHLSKGGKGKPLYCNK